MNPALTSDEWARRLARPHSGALVDFGHCECGAPVVRNLLDDSLPPANRHALAALALHGQPFGFMAKDVKNLRETAEESDEGDASNDFYLGGYQVTVGSEWLLNLADRIAALLPPEAK